MFGSSDNALKIRLNTSKFAQSLNRRQTHLRYKRSPGSFALRLISTCRIRPEDRATGSPSAFGIHSDQWRSCLTPQNRFKKPAPIAPGPARVRRFAQTLPFPQRPLAIRDDVAVHRHANLRFGKLESETITKGNPESQQALDGVERRDAEHCYDR